MEKTQRPTGTNKANRALKIAVECCRVLIGVVFIFSGFVKAVDPMGGAIKIDDYLSAFGLEALQPFSVVMSFNLSAIEFTLGVCARGLSALCLFSCLAIHGVYDAPYLVFSFVQSGF